MAKQKTIPELEAEKAENERKLSQLQHMVMYGYPAPIRMKIDR